MNEQSRLISRNEILSENINDLEKRWAHGKMIIKKYFKSDWRSSKV